MLKFKKIEYENFRGTEYFEYEFENNGLVIITGPNGCGKTTFILAIRDGLFGIKPSRNTKQTRIELEFEYNNIDFKVVRQKKTAILYKDGEEFLSGLQDVNHFLKEELLDPNLLDATVFLQTDFIDLTDKAKKEIIDNIIAIDFDEPRQKTKQYLDQYKGQLTTLEVQAETLATKIEETAKQIDEEKQRIKEHEQQLRDQLTRLQEQKAKLIDQKQQKENQLAQLKQDQYKYTSQEELEKLDKQLVSIEQQIKAKQSQLNQLYDQERQLSLEKEKQKNIFLSSKKDAYITTKMQASQSLQQLEQQQLQINNEANNLKNKIDMDISKLTIQSNNTISVLENDIKKLQFDLDKLLQKACPLCKSPYGNDITEQQQIENVEKFKSEFSNKCPICGKDHSTISADLQKQVDNIKSQIQEKKNKIAEIEANRNKQIEEMRKQLDQELNKYRSLWKDLDKQKSVQAKAIKEIDAQIESLEQTLQKELQKHLESVTKEIEQITISKQQINQELSSLSLAQQEIRNQIQNLFNQKKQFEYQIDQLQQDINQLSQSIHETDLQINLAQNTLESGSYKSHLEDLKHRLELYEKELEEKLNSIETAKRKIKLAKIWYKGFGPKGIKALVLEEVLPAINKTLFNYGLKVDIIPKLIVDEKGRFQIPIISNRVIAEEASELSTGERRIVNILFNIALSAIFNCNAVFFDEAFDGLDANNAPLMMEILSSITENKETFVITHSPIWKTLECDRVLTPGRCYEMI